MTWIALDTSGRACSVAIGGPGRAPLSRTRIVERGHAAVIVPMVRDLAEEVGLDPRSIGGVAVGIGPGSFTGIRTAVSVAYGLCLAAGCGLIGVDGFEATRRGVLAGPGCDGVLVVCLDSGRDEIFVAAFDRSGATLIDPVAATPDRVASWLPERVPTSHEILLTGSTADRVGRALGPRRAWRLVSPGSDILEATWLLPGDAGMIGADPRSVAPLYLRAASVTPPRASDGAG